MAFLELKGVGKGFTGAKGERTDVLRGLDLSIEKGELVAIVGYSGAGKTTLISMIAGLTRPDTGIITLDGKTITEPGPERGVVFQNYSLLPWFSALENVRLAVRAAQPEWPRARQRDQAERYLRLVGLGNALHRRPGQLSGGMRQRVAIARAFATDPEVLFLDEPFGALDALTRANLQQELAGLCSVTDRPVTTVMISNNLDEALLLSDRIIPMTKGPRATLGSPVAVELARPRSAQQLIHDEHAVRAKAHVVECLTDHLHTSKRPAGAPAARPAFSTPHVFGAVPPTLRSDSPDA